MLSRPARRPGVGQVGGVVRQQLRHAVVGQPAPAAEHDQVAGAQLHVGPRPAPVLGAAEPEQARGADRQRHHRVGGALVGVAVQAHPGVAGVVVDHRDVRVVVPGVAVGVRDRPAAQLGEPPGQRGHRRAVLVVAGARVAVRDPVPAQAHRPHAHPGAIGERRRPDAGPLRGPTAARLDELALRGDVEPVGHVHGAGGELAARAGDQLEHRVAAGHRPIVRPRQSSVTPAATRSRTAGAPGSASVITPVTPSRGSTRNRDAAPIFSALAST
jgi:hypothetical protein